MRQPKAEINGIFVSTFLFVFILGFILFTYKVCASVVLNEVAIQPNQAVEIYNTASTSADISGWYIDDAGGATYYTIAPQTILAPQSCYLFTSDFNFNKTTTDTVRLFDSSSQPVTSSAKLIEGYTYSKAPDAGYSFAKKTDGGSEWQTSSSSLGLFNETLTSCIPTATPTPAPTDAPTQTPTATPTITPSPQQPTAAPTDYSNIFISEVFPYPAANEHEWIELYNNNDYQITLDNWYIDDAENTGSTPKSITIVIDPYSYTSIDITSSLFNNSGDSVRVLNSNKVEKDSMEYGKITEGKSIARISFSEDAYCEQEPTKNAANTSCVAPTAKVSTHTESTSGKSTTTQKIVLLPTKKTATQGSQIPYKVNKISNRNPQNKGAVLGTQVKNTKTPILYSSFISFSYSLLTIVSIFIKMKNA